MKTLTVIFLVSLLSTLTIAKPKEKSCENYKLKLEEARKFFKTYKEVELNLTLRSSFIKNYNNFSHDKKKLDVDRLTLFMLLDKTEWYIMGAKNSCFNFWVNLEPDRFVELIDGGSLSNGQGIWVED